MLSIIAKIPGEKDFIFAVVSEEMGGFRHLCPSYLSVQCFYPVHDCSHTGYVFYGRLMHLELNISQVFPDRGRRDQIHTISTGVAAFVSYGGSSHTQHVHPN